MRCQLNEAELEVDSEKASYKQRLEVLQQQEELIEDEEEQEQKEEDARRAKREASERTKREEETRMAESLLPDSEVCFVCFLLRGEPADGGSMAATL
jgi:LETM1 and EF-hand domain-containing protein 1